MPAQPSFLIASTDDTQAAALEAVLFEQGARGRRVHDAAEARVALQQGSFDVLIADGSLGLISSELEIPWIALVAADRVSDGAAAVRAGAADFLRLPVERDEVSYVLAK